MLIALHIMWSAIIWLLVLIGSTIAQYEQQTHMKSRTVQKDMQNAYGVESSLNIPPSKRKYFPAGDIPRPDFKYTKNRKR
uniref:T-cell surface glycoprotein CD3 zeta chain n=1 Tax=Ascaris lumbricoides TaxID=6252 RepID=A0A0M3IRA8_ASCLU